MKRSKEYAEYAEYQHQTSESVGVRTTGRVKKPKTVFDPSDNYLSRAQRSASALAASMAASTIEHTTIPGVLTLVNGSLNNLNTSGTHAATNNNINNNSYGESHQVDYGKGFDTCMKCLKTEPKRGQGFKSKFLQCKTCTKKWHINCINIQFECYRFARDKYKCEKCRSCCVCKRNKNSQIMPKNKEVIMCKLCVDAYHLDCHKPTIIKSEEFDGSFKCSKCESVPSDNLGAKAKKDIEKRSKTSDELFICDSLFKTTSFPDISSTPLALPPLPMTLKVKEELIEEEDQGEEEQQGEEQGGEAEKGEEAKLILATDTKSILKWTVDDVVSFFSKYHPIEAHVFKRHEIDGASLLLLRRNQILKRFNLKLGPSLRIFETVCILQTQEDNIMNTWND